MGIINRFWSGMGTMTSSRTLENPSTPLDDPDDWVYDGQGGEPAAAGVRVNPQTMLGFAPVWRGVFIKANAVAKLPLYVYERDADGEGKHYAHEHPAYPLLLRKPNREMTAFIFRRTMQVWAILHGNAYAYISRTGGGTPDELIPLLPLMCQPVRVDGVLWYVVRTPSNAERKVPCTDILHIKGPGIDPLLGDRLYHRAKDSVGTALAAQRYSGKFFGNGAEPRVTIEHPGKISDKAAKNLRESWNAMHQGIENSHKVAILEEGMKANPFSIDPEKAQLIETRRFSIKDVANWLQVPPHLLGDADKNGYNSLESENQSFLDHSLDPDLVNWEQESYDKLLTEKEKRAETHTVEFMRLALLRGDAVARSQLYHSAILDGWMNPDEARARENLNPMPDGTGKRFYRPANMLPVGGEADAATVDFQRKSWLAFQADGTVSDVQANLTDLKALAKAVGLPGNEDYVDPYLPVVAQPGPLVSGETVKDQDGDVVGADTLPASEGEDPAGEDVGGGTGAGGAAEGEDENGGKQGQRKQQDQSKRAKGAGHDPAILTMREASRQVLLDSVRRMVKRLQTHAVKAAKGGTLDAFLAREIESHRPVIVETIGPAARAAAAVYAGMESKRSARIVEALADGLLAAVRRRIVATDGTPDAVEKALVMKGAELNK